MVGIKSVVMRKSLILYLLLSIGLEASVLKVKWWCAGMVICL